MSKLSVLAIGAVGYVLGTRAGRERYEQIKATATKVAQDPRVRSKAKQAESAVRENAPVVKDKVTEAAGTAKDAVKEKTSGSETAPVTGTDATSTSTYPSS